jgi:hypothetical protein
MVIIMGVGGGGREEKSGYSQGSNSRLAIAGHDFPLRDLK